MIRAAAKSFAPRLRLLTSWQRPCQSQRYQSSAAGGSSGGGAKLALVSIVTIAGAAGGTIAYANFDPEFRKLIQDNVPGSADVLTAILGTEEDDKPLQQPTSTAPPSKMKIQKPIEPVLKPKPVKKEPEKVVTPPPPPPPPPLPLPPPPSSPPVPVPVEEPPKIIEAVVEEDEACKDNTWLEFTLNEACKDTETKVETVLESSKASIDATRHHMALVRSLIDDTPKDEKRAWNEVFEAAAKKLEFMQETDKFLSEAKASLNETINAIEKGRKKSSQENNETVLKSAEQRAAMALGELENVVSALDSVKKEAKLIDEYRNLVEESRQQFEKEIEAILPGSNLSQKSGGALSEEELNIFMTHAYR